MSIIKPYIHLFIILSAVNLFSQEEKETVYLFFDSDSKKKCQIIIEYGQDDDGKLDGYTMVNKYRKKILEGLIYFHICNQKFLFQANPTDKEIDTCSIVSLKDINFKEIEYLEDKYEKSDEFRYHVFKQINLVEKISDTSAVKYFDVYWCCEWVEEN